jgi:hypothetical protein
MEATNNKKQTQAKDIKDDLKQINFIKKHKDKYE